MTAAKTLAEALVAAQTAMPSVEKTGSSNFGKHITLDHLIAQTKRHLAENGLTILQFPCVLETGQPALRTTLLHLSGESLSADAPLFLGDRHTMQALGAALTYARRQGWSAVLGISTEADDDADSVSLPAQDSKPAAVSRQRKNVPDTAEAENVLLALVLAKNGDVEAARADIEKNRGTSNFEAYLAASRDFWETFEPATAA